MRHIPVTTENIPPNLQEYSPHVMYSVESKYRNDQLCFSSLFTDDSYANFRLRHAVGRKKVDTDVFFRARVWPRLLGRAWVLHRRSTIYSIIVYTQTRARLGRALAR